MALGAHVQDTAWRTNDQVHTLTELVDVVAHRGPADAAVGFDVVVIAKRETNLVGTLAERLGYQQARQCSRFEEPLGARAQCYHG